MLSAQVQLLLVSYVCAYGVTLAVGVASTSGGCGRSRRRRLALTGAALLVFALGFPPSPLFVLKLALGSLSVTYCGVWGVVSLSLLIITAWVLLARSLVVMFGDRVVGFAPLSIRSRRRAAFTPIFVVVCVVLASCTPLGLGVVCGL